MIKDLDKFYKDLDKLHTSVAEDYTCQDKFVIYDTLKIARDIKKDFKNYMITSSYYGRVYVLENNLKTRVKILKKRIKEDLIKIERESK